MKIQLLSDLHNEFGVYKYKETDARYVVLAGDIGLGITGVEWALENIPSSKQVIYVCGNHDYWYNNMTKLDKELVAMAENTNVHILNNENSKIRFLHPGGEIITFLGGTLWTDYNLYGRAVLDKLEVQRKMNDFRFIRYGTNNEKITPEVLESCHLALVSQLEEYIYNRSEDDGKLVVVTHHAPHEKSISPEYRNDSTNPAYASDLTYLMDAFPGVPSFIAPDLWIFGHIHWSSDYKIGETRVVSNPRGYEGVAPNPNFIDDLVLEV